MNPGELPSIAMFRTQRHFMRLIRLIFLLALFMLEMGVFVFEIREAMR